jgi:hypothetical protein
VTPGKHIPITMVVSLALIMATIAAAEWGTQEAVTPGDSVWQDLSEYSRHCVAVDGFGKVHAVWQDWGVPVCIRYNSRSPLSGWGLESFRVSPPGVWEPEDPTICCNAAGNVFVAWHVQGDTTGRVQVNYRMYSPETGWDSETGLVDNSASFSRSAVMEASGSVHVVWLRATHLWTNQVMYRRFVQGEGWSEPVALTNTPQSESNGLTIAEDDGSLHVVWRESDYSTYCNVYYRRYDPGAGWDSVATCVNVGDDAWSPSVAVGSDGCVHVVFTMWADGDANEIFYRCWSPTAGWDTTETPISSHDSIHSGNADVACDDLGRVHVVWQDGRDGGDEIYERVLTPGAGWGDETPLTANENGDLYPHLISGTCGLHLVWENVRIRYMNQPGSASGIPEAKSSQDNGEAPRLTVQIGPNPFSERATISYRLPNQAFTALEVYGVTGQVVVRLFKGPQTAGPHSITWDGRDRYGKPVQPGVYFVRIQSGQATAVKLIVLLR